MFCKVRNQLLKNSFNWFIFKEHYNLFTQLHGAADISFFDTLRYSQIAQ